MLSIIIFFILNFINVILGTLRSVLTVKASPIVATIVNVVSYTFYSGIVKLTSGQPMVIVLATTALTNLVGVYIAKILLNKFRKDKLWRITATVPGENASKFYSCLIDKDISCGFGIRGKWTTFDCYSETKEQTDIIKSICKKYNAKIFISENII